MSAFRLFFADGVRTSIIMGAGDVLAQTYVEKTHLQKLDVVRTAKFASLGFLFVGPTLRLWYSYLDKIVPLKEPPFKRAFKKMLIDQICFAPVFTAALTGIVCTMNGETQAQVKKRLKKDYITMMERNYMLWPAAQMINFSLVPVQYQVAFAQVIAVIWNCYLSVMFNK